MEYDYLQFRDDLLLELVNEIEPPSIPSVRLEEVAKKHGLSYYPSWIEAVGRDYANAGYGLSTLVDGVEYFEINGAGIARATEIRRSRKPPAFLDKLAADRTQKLLNVGAFVISILSLVVAAIALLKAGS